MDLSVFDDMKEGELRDYLTFLLWHYRLMDAFWFIYVSDTFGQEHAERINEKVWSRVPEMGTRDLLQRFGITDKGSRASQRYSSSFRGRSSSSTSSRRGTGRSS